jgi:hypothetical protein
LQVVPDSLLDREGVLFMAAPPAREFGRYKEEGYYEHSYGPFSAARCAGYVLRF